MGARGASPLRACRGRWRALSAIAKADHVVALAAALGLDSPRVVADVGCGDGSVLLEHVPTPAVFPRELMRVGRAIVVEVPLERNLPARRAAARRASEAAGHIQRFDRTAIRDLIDGEGCERRGETVDPLGLDVHVFGREALGARAKGAGKWAVDGRSRRFPPSGRES